MIEIRCSKLDRFMNCIGIAAFDNLEEPEAGQPAKEGTACGELLSAMIEQKTLKPRITAYASNGVFIDKDMWYHAGETYMDVVKNAGHNNITTEQRIDWQAWEGFLIRGQYDIEYLTPNTLHIEDLKYGYGIVEVEKNWQLIGYAIGRYLQLGQQGIKIDQVKFRIHQPRPYHPKGRVREWVIDIGTLAGYYDRIKNRANHFLGGVKSVQTGKHCKYCPAANSCPAFNNSVWNGVETALNEWQQDTLTNQEIGSQIKLLERVQDILKMKVDSLRQLAIMRLQSGQVVPGYVFEPELGDRKWKDGVTAESLAIMTGIDLTKKDMMSPNQAEKAGLSKKFVAQLVERSNKGMKLIAKDIVEEANQILPKPY